MPTFILKDGRYFVSYITGPSHIFLGLRFVQQAGRSRMVKLPPVGQQPPEQLDEVRIRSAVEEAMSEHNQSNPTAFIDEISYVEDDTPRYTHFKIAAALLIQHFTSRGRFEESA
jgi:hypothetical protein